MLRNDDISPVEQNLKSLSMINKALKEPSTIDQLAILRDKIGDRPGSRRLKANLWIPEIDLQTFSDQPCFQEVKIENLNENKAHLSIVFRSWDAFNGLPFNLPAITNLIHKEIMEPNNMEIIRFSADGKDTHIYDANQLDSQKITLSAKDLDDILYF